MAAVTFTIHGDDLNAAAAWAARLCPAKPSVPVLQGIMLDAAEDGVTFTAYDFEISGAVTMSALVTNPGRVLIPGRLLAAVAKVGARDAQVAFTCDGSTASVRVGRNSWTLPLLPVEDYPILPGAGGSVAKLDGAALRRALDRVLPAADRTGTAPLRSSVAVVGDTDGLMVCGTDKYRLAVATVPWSPASEDATLDVLVPVEFLEAAVRALGTASAPVELAGDDGVFTLASPSHRLTGRLTAADWPQWRRLLPTSWASIATFVVDELADALDRALAVSDEKRPIRLDVDEAGFELAVWGDDRAGHSVAPVSDYSGEPQAIGVNPRFLRDALNTLGTDLAAMRFGPRIASPVDLVPLDGDGEPEPGYRHLVMPVHPDKVRKAASQ